MFDQWPFLRQALDRGQPLGRDAYSLWTAGWLALHDRARDVYDVAAFIGRQESALDTPIQALVCFLYPPPAIPLFAGLAILPYGWALTFWWALGIGTFVAAVAAPRFEWTTVVLCLLAPMTVFNLIMGQTGLLCAALFIGGARLSSRHPYAAGVCFGLLTFKPFLGLFIPVLLIARRQWRTFFAATVATLLFNGLPVVLWGWPIWGEFVSQAVPLQRQLLHAGSGIGVAMMPSVFNAMRLLGSGLPSAYLVHGAALCGVLVLVGIYLWRTRRRSAISAFDILIFALATALASPYLHNYDLSLLEGALILVVTGRAETNTRSVVAPGIVVILIAAGLLSFILNLTGVPLYPVFLTVAFAVLLLRGSRNGWPEP